MRVAAAVAALLTCFQAIIAHCHASHQPLLRLRLAHPLQTIINRAAAHGLHAWLSSIPLPLLHSAGPPSSIVPPLPLWFAAAVTVMDDSTLKQVLTAAAAAAAAFAAALVARSDASLTPPCAAAAAQWCALLPMLITPPHVQAAASAPCCHRYAAVRSLWQAAGQDAWASAGLADVLQQLRCVATNALVM